MDFNLFQHNNYFKLIIHYNLKYLIKKKNYQFSFTQVEMHIVGNVGLEKLKYLLFVYNHHHFCQPFSWAHEHGNLHYTILIYQQTHLP